MKVPLSTRVFLYFNNTCHQPLQKRKAIVLLLFTFLFSLSSFAQQITVTGKVSRGDTALAGVTVSVKNTTDATRTNEAGVYSIKTVPDATLVFTSVGFEAQEIKINNQSVLNIELMPVNQQLEDVIVVGYGTQRRGNITGAVANIKSSDLMRTPSSTATSALVGRVAGITARQTTGRPGQGTNIQIRNLGNPLYVIDGVPQTVGQFNNISTEDIESISILRTDWLLIFISCASNPTEVKTKVAPG